MFRNKFLLAFVTILLLFICTQNIYASDSGINLHFKKPKIKKELIKKVKFIRKDANLIKNKYFYNFLFYQENDSIFLNISYDRCPPFIISDKVDLLGYSVYKNNYLVFMNFMIPHELINYFMETKRLYKDIAELWEIGYGIDGKTYVFYINELKELVFIRKYRY
jgi:hypothetical protein